eukprot:90567-Prymnesium_polylepis.1
MCVVPADAVPASADGAPADACPAYGDASSRVEESDEGSFAGKSDSRRGSRAAVPSSPRSRAKARSSLIWQGTP